MIETFYECNSCGYVFDDWVPHFEDRKRWKRCPICGKQANRRCSGGGGGLNACTGEIVSDNLGCGIGQEAQGNRDLAEANIDAHYRESDGALVAANRQAFQEATACRGLISHTDGGFSGQKLRRIREQSLRGNPRRN